MPLAAVSEPGEKAASSSCWCRARCAFGRRLVPGPRGCPPRPGSVVPHLVHVRQVRPHVHVKDVDPDARGDRSGWGLETDAGTCEEQDHLAIRVPSPDLFPVTEHLIYVRRLQPVALELDHPVAPVAVLHEQVSRPALNNPLSPDDAQSHAGKGDAWLALGQLLDHLLVQRNPLDCQQDIKAIRQCSPTINSRASAATALRARAEWP